MYIERDVRFDLLYVSFKDDREDGDVAETKELYPGAYLDLDSEGRLLGIEVINATKVLGVPASEVGLKGEILGVKEAAELAGKDKANFLRDLAGKPGFPPPVAEPASGRLWLSRDIARFLGEREDRRQETQAAVQVGLSDRQRKILVAVADQEGALLEEVASLCGTSIAVAYQELSVLERRGFVVPSGASGPYSVTPVGREALDGASEEPLDIATEESPNMAEFEIFRDSAGEYRWRLQAANGEIVAASEGYTRSADARRSAERVKQIAPQARFETRA